MNKARGLFVFLLLVIPMAISCAGMQTVRIGTEGPTLLLGTSTTWGTVRL